MRLRSWLTCLCEDLLLLRVRCRVSSRDFVAVTAGCMVQGLECLHDCVCFVLFAIVVVAVVVVVVVVVCVGGINCCMHACMHVIVLIVGGGELLLWRCYVYIFL